MMNDSLTYSHEKLTRWVSATLSPVILLGCALGNLISFLVLLQPRLRRQTTSIYLAALCIAEIGTCYTGLLRQFLLDAIDLDIRAIHSMSCRTHIYLTYVFLRLVPILLALVTLQRYFYVNKRDICSPKSSSIQLIIVFFFVCLAEFHLFLFYEFTHSDTRPRSEHIPFECTVDKFLHPDYYRFRTMVYPKISLFLYTIIPLTIIILGNMLIVRTVRRASKRSRSSTHKKRSVTRMLYAVSVVYTLLTSPASIFLAIVPTSYQLAPSFRLQWTLLRLLFYLCHSVNFLLFCASGEFFRQEFHSFLQNKCCFSWFQCKNRRKSCVIVGVTKYDDKTTNYQYYNHRSKKKIKLKEELILEDRTFSL